MKFVIIILFIILSIKILNWINNNCENFKVSQLPNLSKYVKKTQLVPCPKKYCKKTKCPILPDLNKFIKKTEIPSCPRIPDLSKYVLKSSIKPMIVKSCNKNNDKNIDILSLKYINKCLKN